MFLCCLHLKNVFHLISYPNCFILIHCCNSHFLLSKKQLQHILQMYLMHFPSLSRICFPQLLNFWFESQSLTFFLLISITKSQHYLVNNVSGLRIFTGTNWTNCYPYSITKVQNQVSKVMFREYYPNNGIVQIDSLGHRSVLSKIMIHCHNLGIIPV